MASGVNSTTIDARCRLLLHPADGQISINPALGRGWTREHVVFHVLGSAQANTQPVNEFYRVSNGWYLGYSTDEQFTTGAWRRAGQVFHVPVWNGVR